MNVLHTVPLKGYIGMKIDPSNGLECFDTPGYMATPMFMLANPGDHIIRHDEHYHISIVMYTPEINPSWLYTYVYAPDQSWTTYQSIIYYTNQNNYYFTNTIYFRLTIQKNDLSPFNTDEDINNILSFYVQEQPIAKIKPWILKEANRVTKNILSLRKQDCLAFALMTDTHYTVNGTWQDSLASIKQMHKEIKMDGIIHLGDISDGMVTKDATRLYTQKVISDLNTCNVPLYTTIGNHDTNYFRNNPQPFTEDELCQLFGHDIRYYIDLPQLRLVFIDSFNPNESLRYGYSDDCIQWLEKTLNACNPEQKVIIFSHLPPVTRLQFWAKKVRGEDELMDLLIKHNILAWVNGHNHADHLDNKSGFPIISIANGKCECFFERKPEGFISPGRRLGDASQELWDILLINTKDEAVHFIRFGAGKDRVIKDGSVSWL